MEKQTEITPNNHEMEPIIDTSARESNQNASGADVKTNNQSSI